MPYCRNQLLGQGGHGATNFRGPALCTANNSAPCKAHKRGSLLEAPLEPTVIWKGRDWTFDLHLVWLDYVINVSVSNSQVLQHKRQQQGREHLDPWLSQPRALRPSWPRILRRSYRRDARWHKLMQRVRVQSRRCEGRITIVGFPLYDRSAMYMYIS